MQLPLSWSQAAGAAQHCHSAEPYPIMIGGRNTHIGSAQISLVTGGRNSLTLSLSRTITDWQQKQHNLYRINKNLKLVDFAGNTIRDETRQYDKRQWNKNHVMSKKYLN
jgi:hypothetical protein